MSAKHSPGPWQQKHEYSAEGRLTIIANVDGEIDADGRVHNTFDTIARCSDEFEETLPNAEANARLIAAAPEVVEAAQAYMAAVAALGECNPDSKLTYFEESPTKNDEAYIRWIALNNTGKALSAAIAKATRP